MPRHVLALALYLAIALTAQVWPGYLWAAARIEPFVLGLPFSFFWVIAWVAATFLALNLFHRADSNWRQKRG